MHRCTLLSRYHIHPIHPVLRFLQYKTAQNSTLVYIGRIADLQQPCDTGYCCKYYYTYYYSTSIITTMIVAKRKATSFPCAVWKCRSTGDGSITLGQGAPHAAVSSAGAELEH